MRTFAAVAVLFAWGFFTATADATPPWRGLLNIRHVEADANKSYELQESNGPWCILTTSFSGPTAEEEAHELVIELRRRHGLEAYTHKQRYDFSQTVSGLGVDKYGAPKRMQYLHGGEIDEVAVLVGNFPSVDDPAVEKTLDTIKYAQPNSLRLDGRKQRSQRFAQLRAVQRYLNESDEKRKRGPMGSAFVTRNPLLPQEFFAPDGVDRFVLEMNKPVPHSLLDCPGKYSVRVATFRGNVILDQKKIRAIEEGEGFQTRLDSAAEKAHKLTEALRDKGIEAYEFHDRYESIVTVGNFNAVGSPREDGRIEINPGVHRIMQQYGARQQALPGGSMAPALMPRTLAGVAFDVQPVPVEVPKRSIAADYARSWR